MKFVPHRYNFGQRLKSSTVRNVCEKTIRIDCNNLQIYYILDTGGRMIGNTFLFLFFLAENTNMAS